MEARVYGLLDRMMPYYAQERVGQSLLTRACLVGTTAALQTAVAQVRTLIFTMGDTTPFLDECIQDMRFVITDCIVNGSPVWVAEGNDDTSKKYGMYRSDTRHMIVTNETDITASNGGCF